MKLKEILENPENVVSSELRNELMAAWAEMVAENTRLKKIIDDAEQRRIDASARHGYPWD